MLEVLLGASSGIDGHCSGGGYEALNALSRLPTVAIITINFGVCLEKPDTRECSAGPSRHCRFVRLCRTLSTDAFLDGRPANTRISLSRGTSDGMDLCSGVAADRRVQSGSGLPQTSSKMQASAIVWLRACFIAGRAALVRRDA